MRILIILAFLFFSFSLSAQLLITNDMDSAAFREKPMDKSKPIIRILKGTQMKAIGKAYDYLKVVYKTDTGYLYRGFIKEVNETIKPGDYKKMEQHTKFLDKLNHLPEEELTKALPSDVDLTDRTINGALAMYGNEDEKNQYQMGTYDAITLIWHCAKGRYRSITYVFKDGGYFKDSEFVSNCL
jgi:hypothetical protein